MVDDLRSTGDAIDIAAGLAVEGCDTGEIGIAEGITMDGDEDIGVSVVGDLSADGEACGNVVRGTDGDVAGAGIDDFCACLSEKGTSVEGDGEGDVFFLDAIGYSTGIVAAVSGVEDDDATRERAGGGYGVGDHECVEQQHEYAE